MNGEQLNSTEQVTELQDFINLNSDERIIRTAKGSAEIYLTEDAVCVTSDGHNGMVVNKYGTTIDGKVNLVQDPNNIRISGFWTLNNELLTTLPSTLYTPIPVLVYDEPASIVEVQSLASYLQEMAG